MKRETMVVVSGNSVKSDKFGLVLSELKNAGYLETFKLESNSITLVIYIDKVDDLVEFLYSLEKFMFPFPGEFYNDNYEWNLNILIQSIFDVIDCENIENTRRHKTMKIVEDVYNKIR